MSAVPTLPEELLETRIPNSDDAISEESSLNKRKRIDSGNTRVFTNGETSHASTFQLQGSPVENFRPLKVIVIGAGYSGIYLGIRIPERIRNCELVIYEKNDGVGGTWFENRYPGCACDVPSHSYQYSFSPNPSWSSLYAPSHEIQSYLSTTAKKFGADRFIKLSHEVTSCTWNDKDTKWHVKVKNLASGEEFEDEADILVSARGNLNNFRWPDIEGLNSFKGEVMHSARWNQDYDFTSKRIGIIGSGSSAIQIIPSLQRLQGTELSCFIRSPTWISPPFAQDVWEKLGITSYLIPPSTRQRFASDAEEYYKFRLTIEEALSAVHGATIDGHPIQQAGRKMFKQHMENILKEKKPDILNTLLPNFSPGCRRLTPGPGFLESLTQDNVSFISSGIKRIEEEGIRTNDGALHPIDVLCCATGFHTSTAPPFPVTGSKGISLKDQWTIQGRPKTYLSLSLPNFPNHFLLLGPNSAIGSGSLTMMIESVGDYVTKCIRKIQRDNIRSMVVKEDSVDDFIDYCDAYFDKTVFVQECRSWYKSGSADGTKVTGLWPGSTQHCIEVLRSPRWEDYEYSYVGDEEEDNEDQENRTVKKKRGANRMAWLGNGWSINQLEEKDLAWYLYPEFVDKPNEGKPEENNKYRIRSFCY